jgi:hypothetical protein
MEENKSKRTSRIWKMSKEDLQKILDESTGICDALKNLNYNSRAVNYKTLTVRITEDGLSLDKMIANGKLLQKNGIKRETSEMLVEDSNVDRKLVKNRIIKEGLLEYKCVLCGNNGIWNGKELTLQLDHINGDNKDNRISNLRLLCPNDHSQTDTFAGRNAKRDIKEDKDKEPNFCQDCNKEILSGSKKCSPCNNKIYRKFDATKEDLEKLINEGKPLTGIGKMYGVTDNAIKKRCSAYGITLKRYNTSKNYQSFGNGKLPD